MLFEELVEISGTKEGVIPKEYFPVLIKNSHRSLYGLEYEEELFRSSLSRICSNHVLKELVGRFLGYGKAEITRVMECSERRVTVLGFGEIKGGQAQQFSLPLPPSLSSQTEERKLIITLGWFTPIKCSCQKYRIAQLWFDPAQKLAPDRKCVPFQSVRRGSLQHEILKGKQAFDFQDGELLSIKVNCRPDAVRWKIQFDLA
jgi:hypothetical protein